MVRLVSLCSFLTSTRANPTIATIILVRKILITEGLAPLANVTRKRPNALGHLPYNWSNRQLYSPIASVNAAWLESYAVFYDYDGYGASVRCYP